jgi:hypothetical protein
MLEQGAWLKSIALTFVAAVILWLAIPVFVELKSRFDVNNEIDSKISARTKDLEVARKQNVKDKEVALAGALDEVKLAKEALKNLSHRGAPPLLDILSNDRVFDDSFRAHYARDTVKARIRNMEYNWGGPAAASPSYLLQIVLASQSGALAFAIRRPEVEWARLGSGLVAAGLKGALLIILLLGGMSVLLTRLFSDFELLNPFSIVVLAGLSGALEWVGPREIYERVRGNMWP